VAPASFDHSFFESGRPSSHAIPKVSIRLGSRKRAGAIAIALGWIFDDIVLVRRDQLALPPDRRAHGAVAMDCIVGPIPAGIGEVESAGKGAGHHSEAELAGEQLGMALDAFEVARATMEQEEAGIFAVGANRDLA
jgi:hypothetical protein